MKRVELIKHLKRHGCCKLREGANHSVWYNPASNRQTAVPRHREIANTIAATICKQLEVPRP